MTNRNKVPSNWRIYHRNNDNKTDLFHFLADKIAEITVPNVIIVTKGPKVLSTSEFFLDTLDVTMKKLTLVSSCMPEGHKTIMIKANDTDIVMIALSVFPYLQSLGLQQMWVTFRQGQSQRWISMQDFHWM